MDQLRNVVAPLSDDSALAQRQSGLYRLLLILAAASLLSAVVLFGLWVYAAVPLTGALSSLLSFPFLFLAYLLGRQGYVSIAGVIISGVLFAVIVVAMISLGFGGIVAIGMAAGVIVSAQLLGLAAGGIFIVVNLFAFGLITAARASRLLPQPALGDLPVVVEVLGLGLSLGVLTILFREVLQRGEVPSGRLEPPRVHQQAQALQGQIDVYRRELSRQSTMLQTATDITRMAAELAGPLELMRATVSHIRERFGYYQTSIFLVDETGAWLELTTSSGEAGRRLLVRDQRLAVGSATIVGWAAANREARIAQDVLKDPYHRKNPLLLETRAEAAIPLLVGDHLLGVLDIQSRAVGAFSESEIQALQGIADTLTMAYENARLLQERESDMKRFSQEYREQAQSSWDHLYQSGAKTLVQLGIDGELDAELACVDEATTTGETVLSADRAEVAVPVVVRGLVIAAIGARKQDPGDAWSESEVALLETVAAQAGLALETARQYAEERRRVTELEALNRISQAASQLLQPDTLMRVLQRQVTQVVGECDLIIARYDDQMERMSFPYAMIEGSQKDLTPRPLGRDLLSSIIRTRQPLLLPDHVYQRATQLNLEPRREEDCASWLGVPLLAGDVVVGAIALLDHRNPRHFTQDDIAFLTTISSQVATAIQNSELLAQIQRTARRDRLIREITSKIRRSADIPNVLETAAQELGRSFDARYTRIRIGKPRPDGSRDGGSSRTVEPENDQGLREGG